MKELSKDIYCLFEIIYVITIYHYIAATNVLLGNIIIHYINVVTKPPRTVTNTFLSINIS